MPHESTNVAELDSKSLLDRLKTEFEDFISNTQTSRDESLRDRAYVDHNQWSPEEEQKLRTRGQAPVVINRVKKKVNFLIGVNENTQTDPKAFPRTPKHEKGAEAITDALRFVADNVDFDDIDSDVFESRLVEGYGGAMVTTQKNGDGEIEVVIDNLPWDRIYYDWHSIRRDFADKGFSGISIWVSKSEAKETYPDKADEIDLVFEANSDITLGTSFGDKPEDVDFSWVDKNGNGRIRINQVYFKLEGVWKLAHFTADTWLIEPMDSPELDEFGNPQNPMELQSAYVSQQGFRYGEVRGDIWTQDEINHRRSKALHLTSVRQTLGRKGAIDDVDEMKHELSRADGHVEVQGTGRLDENFQLLSTNEMAQAQFSLMQEAKAEIDTGEVQAVGEDTGESGRSRQIRQQTALTAKGRIFKDQTRWRRRIFRQVHNRIKQHWTKEKWIRVTDDDANIRFVGLNQEMKKGQLMVEKAKEGDERAFEKLRQMSREAAQNSGRQLTPEQAMALVLQDPRMQETTIVNNVQELDVDIILLETETTATIQQEQFEEISRLAATYGPEFVPFEMVLELSELRGKQRILDRLKDKQEEDPARTAAREAAARKDQADLANTEAETEKTLQEAQGEAIESALLLEGDVDTIVAIT